MVYDFGHLHLKGDSTVPLPRRPSVKRVALPRDTIFIVIQSYRKQLLQLSLLFLGLLYSNSILGDILQEAVRQLQPGVKVGKILIQRDESSESKTPVLYYKKLPKDIADCFVILVDPMLATAGESSTHRRA